MHSDQVAKGENSAEGAWGLTREVLGCPAFLPITRAEFAGLKAAQAGVLLILRVEEKFDALLQNYAEYERELLSLTLERTVFRELEWSGLIGDLHTMNRRLANVLTMARAYLDHTKQDVNVVSVGSEEMAGKLEIELSLSYDSSRGYRVMEALRNHLQHCGFPIGSISYPSEWQGNIRSPQARLRSRLTTRLDMPGLRGNPQFKRSVLDELDRTEIEGHDVTIYLREYIEGLGRAHERLREMWSKAVGRWEDTIQKAIDQYRKFADGNIVGMVAVSRCAEGKRQEVVPVFADPVRRLQHLRSKNALLANISRRYISNELP